MILQALVVTSACEKTENANNGDWSLVYANQPAHDLIDMHFVNENDGFILANAKMGAPDSTQLLIHTNDGGQTWTETRFELENRQLITDIHVFSDRVILGITTAGEVVESNNLGNTWITKSNTNLPSASQITFPFVGNSGFIAAKSHIYRSLDQGLSWKTVYASNIPQAERLIFPETSETGYAIGGYMGEAQMGGLINRGWILKTIDAGTTWTALPTEFTGIADAYFLSNETGFVFTNDRTLWGTKNGGVSWSVITDEVLGSYIRMWFASERQGFIAGNDIGVLSTTDGGQNWEVALPAATGMTGTSAVKFEETTRSIYVMINGMIVYRPWQKHYGND